MSSYSSNVYSHALRLLKKHEGLRLKPYKCSAGKLTIGYGHNLEDKGLSKEFAEVLLLQDTSDCIQALNIYLPWWERKPGGIKIVLINMCFNLGITGLLSFKKTLAAIKEDSYDKAAKEMLDSKWAVQVGNRATELSDIVRSCAK